MCLEIHVSSSSCSRGRWYLPVVFTATNTSTGERCSTGGGGALLRGGPLIARLSRLNFLKYAENTSPPVAAAGGPPLGCPTVTTSMPVTSRQVTALSPVGVIVENFVASFIHRAPTSSSGFSHPLTHSLSPAMWF